MRVKSVTFGFTKSLPNFQSARADCSVEVNEGEDTSEALDLAEAVVRAKLDLPLEERHHDALEKAGLS